MFRALINRYLAYGANKTISFLSANAGRNFNFYFTRAFGRRAVYAVGGGGSASVALSLFGSSAAKADSAGDDRSGGGGEGAPSVDMLVREADLLYNSYLVDNAYNILRKYRTSENSELLWRLARVLCEQAKQCKNDAEKKRLFEEALEYAEKAVKFAPEAGSFGAHKWYAIILDYAAEQVGTKERLKKTYDVKTHLERALEINPLDATTWHILGVWHFTFADISPRLYYAAKLLFATPPRSSYEEALRHFERAEAINPGFYSANIYYMALTKERMAHYLEMPKEEKKKNLEESKKLLLKAFFFPVVSVDDRVTHEKVFEHLKKKYGYTQESLEKEAPTM